SLAIFVCALALGSCNGGYGSGPSYGGHGHGGHGHREISSYGQRDNNGGAAAAAAAAAAPVEIVAGGPRYGGSEHLRPILLDSGYNGGNSGYGQSIGHRGGYESNNRHQGNSGYGQHGSSGYGQQRGYGRPRWSVQPAGATLLYPGQNHYRSYASPPEYTKVLLPIRAAAPVAKLYVPENNYGSQGGYQNEGPRY
ncbi:hypothetical protein KR044_005022, partial [Drosophila immigrans]